WACSESEKEVNHGHAGEDAPFVVVGQPRGGARAGVVAVAAVRGAGPGPAAGQGLARPADRDPQAGPQAAGGPETGGGGWRGAAADGTEDPGGPAADRRTTLQGTGGRAVAGLPTTGTGPGRIETVARWRLSRRHGQGPGEDDRGQAEGAPGPGKEA